MAEKKYYTNAKHYKEFMKECDYWIKFFGLNEWDAIYQHTVPEENDSYASVSPELIGRLAVFNLNKDWGCVKPTTSRVRRYAFHEFCEVRYAKISGHAILRIEGLLNMKKKENKKFVEDLRTENEEIVHSLIRSDENCIWKPMYLKRFKRKINLED